MSDQSHQPSFSQSIPEMLIEKAVSAALEEDLGLRGDITTNNIFSNTIRGTATLRARETGTLAGQDFFTKTFQLIETNSEITWHKTDGAPLTPKEKIATINASVRTILTAERTALNFLGHLSGIASLTRRFVDQVSHTNAKIVDTRKTTPGLRFAQKYAVTAGGAANHRFRLDDAVMIKDNHIAFAGSITKAIEKVTANLGHMVKIEVEVDNLEQLETCLKHINEQNQNHKIDAVLLDNMSVETLSKAVKMIDGKLIAEASGGVNLNTVKEIAETGVDIISVGALTHSAPCLDLGLDIDIPAA